MDSARTSLRIGRLVRLLAPPMITLDGHSLGIDSVIRVARWGERVRLAPRAAIQIQKSHAELSALISAGTVAYGVTTGFGELANVVIPKKDIRRLQFNLLRSHAVGQGEPLATEEVRASMVLRANAVAVGRSGVRPVLVRRIIEMVNHRVHPVVPSRGSLGASGDLVPLAHIGLVLIGEGRAEFGGEVLPARVAMRRAGIEPISLEAKEGIALINGTSVSAALGALAVHDGLALLKDAQVAAAMSFDALGADRDPFEDRVVALKPHKETRAVARNMRGLLRGSELGRTQDTGRHLQDSDTLRCIPQVLGACQEVFERVREVVGCEMNAATDNPVIFDGELLTGGNFHGQALAMELDQIALAATVIAGYAERRIARLIDSHLSGMPPFLVRQGGLNSGLMLMQYVAAALTSENKVLAHPASADSIPTSAGQEDYNPMTMGAALKARQAIENARRVVAMEYYAAAQALEFSETGKPGRGVHRARCFIRRAIPPLVEDRSISEELELIRTWIEKGQIIADIEAVLGRLK